MLTEAKINSENTLKLKQQQIYLYEDKMKTMKNMQ